MAETCAINFPTLVSYSTLIVIGVYLQPFRRSKGGRGGYSFFQQVRKSSDPSSLTFCCGGIFLRKPTIFGLLVHILETCRMLQKYPE